MVRSKLVRLDPSLRWLDPSMCDVSPVCLCILIYSTSQSELYVSVI